MGLWTVRRMLAGAVGLVVAVGCSSGPTELAEESSNPLEATAEAEACRPPDGVVPESCTVEIVDGIAKKCCKDPYTGVRNCTNFACDFHNACDLAGIACETVRLSCGDVAHRTNIAWIEGKGWCWVDPLRGTVNEPCYAKKDDLLADKDLVCRMIYREPGCNCWIRGTSAEPIQPNTRPWLCREKSSTFQECTGCCGSNSWYKYCVEHATKKGYPIETCDKWHDQCLNECQGLPIR